MVGARHPEPHIRRAVRVLAMVGELHRQGHQRLGVMPFMSPAGLGGAAGLDQTRSFSAIMAPFFAKRRLHWRTTTNAIKQHDCALHIETKVLERVRAKEMIAALVWHRQIPAPKAAYCSQTKRMSLFCDFVGLTRRSFH
jgi:hypothetical protein